MTMGLARWAPRARAKYGAARVEVDGLVFDSRREAARYRELKLLLAAGVIRDLEIHPRYPLQVVALYRDPPPWVIEHVGSYTADFRYVDVATGELVIEDVKAPPTRTTAYRLRKRIVEAVHGVAIREVD